MLFQSASHKHDLSIMSITRLKSLNLLSILQETDYKLHLYREKLETEVHSEMIPLYKRRNTMYVGTNVLLSKPHATSTTSPTEQVRNEGGETMQSCS